MGSRLRGMTAAQEMIYSTKALEGGKCALVKYYSTDNSDTIRVLRIFNAFAVTMIVNDS
jgi:hypothetical protein